MRPFLLLLVTLVAGAPPHAQAGDCQLVSSSDTYKEGNVVRVLGPVVIGCPKGVVIRADSARVLQDQGQSYLYGHVHYTDSTKTLRIDADRGRMIQRSHQTVLAGNVQFLDTAKRISADSSVYSQETDIEMAYRNVVVTDLASKSTLTASQVTYVKARTAGKGVDERPEQVVAINRPHVRIEPRDTSERRTDIDADVIEIFGGNRYTGTGTAIIQRPDLNATGSKVIYTRGDIESVFELSEPARMENDSFHLSARTITGHMVRDTLSLLVAAGDSRLESDSSVLTAPTQRMDFLHGKASQLSTIGGHAEMLATGYRMTADSVHVALINEELDQLWAVGSARAESLTGLAREGLDIKLRHDFMAGDTVHAWFSPSTTARAGSRAVQMTQVLALGKASVLYRATQDSLAPPGINYTTGSSIMVRLVDQQIRTVSATGRQSYGVYADPDKPASATKTTTSKPTSGKGGGR